MIKALFLGVAMMLLVPAVSEARHWRHGYYYEPYVYAPYPYYYRYRPYPYYYGYYRPYRYWYGW